MKFRKDGNIFDDILVAWEHYKCPGPCIRCGLSPYEQCNTKWIENHPQEAARLMGYEVLEENSDNLSQTLINDDKTPIKGVEIDQVKEANMDKPLKDWTAKELYRRAIDTYGPDAQTRMVMEEMAELQKELCKYSRGADNLASIAEEIADVEIMLEQMMVLHDCESLVAGYKRYKLDRLEERLK